MKSSVDAPRLRRVPRGAQWPKLITPIRRVPQRLRERRFWQVQALVLAATAPHYVLESLGLGNPSEVLYGLVITAYIVPVLFAALAFGWEGAILTSLWAAVLTSASILIWDHSLIHWLGELGQLAIILPVGVLVAWRVDLEAKQRLRAEKTSASLRLLNEVGEILSNALEVERQLPQVLSRLMLGLSLESAWLCLEPDPGVSGPLTTVEAAAPHAQPPTGLAQDLHRRVAASRAPALKDDVAVAVPLLGETGMLGSLGAKVGRDESFSNEQVDLLITVARQVRVALENARLYRQRQESLKLYVRQITQAQEEERKRLARELHDETAQTLAALLVGIQTSDDALPESPMEAKRALARLKPQATRALVEMRKMILDLRPSALDDLGLASAIRSYAENTLEPAGVALSYKIFGKEKRLPGPLETALFRMAQEAINNVARHAGARTARLKLRFANEKFVIDVDDDGRGFDVQEAVSTGEARGLGLLGMQERASLFEGSVKIDSKPGAGTRVHIEAPTK
jgi:signal transduction histidine kinase